MRKLGLLKSLVVVGLSIALIASLVTVVRADNTTTTNTFSDWDTPITTTGNNTANTANTANTNAGWTTPVTTNNTTNTNTNTNANVTTVTMNTTKTNTNSENVNSLAYTGIGDNSILAVVAVLGILVAGYSFKKVKEYNV